jgi:putative ABC transport system permease protein
MLKNYFMIAWRNIVRHRIYASINVLGLALGITCCILIFLWVRDEKSVDNFGAAGDELYTVYTTYSSNGQVTGATYNSPVRYDSNQVIPHLLAVKNAVPEIKDFAVYTTGYELPWGFPESLQVGDKVLKLDGARAGEDFFKMFPFPLVEGNAATILRDMHGIALSRRTAVALFGSPGAAMGKNVHFQNKYDFVVTGVFDNLPATSSLHFDFLNNWEAQRRLLEWASNDFRCYVRLAPGADRRKAEDGMTKFMATAMGPVKDVQVRIGLQKVSDQYLYNIFSNGNPATGRIEYVRIFSGVAIFILLIACINFMNLATARSVKRAKEVGLRKVVGSSRGQLIGQFFGESLLFALLAMGFSIVFVVGLLPAFNELTGKAIHLPWQDAGAWMTLLVIVMVTGLVAGSYPALYLSSLRPVRVLKGVLKFTSGSIFVRKGLTVFQFALSIVLLIATIVITRQTDYVRHTNLGYDRENLVYVRVEGALSAEANYLLFKQRVSAIPGIAAIDRSSETPHSMNFIIADAIKWEGMPKAVNTEVPFEPASVGFDFVKLMKLSIVRGRDFSRQYPTDSTDAFLVNEEAVKQMGLKDPIGKWISAWQKKGHIVGVVKDYHTRSLHAPITPVIMDIKEDQNFGVIMIRTRAGQTQQALAGIETVYKQLNPHFAFAYQFVDEEYQKMYNSELTTSRLSVLFATLAIIISCLGLLGLVLFAAEQRTREIGIRKVLGASLVQIVTLFSTDFLRLIGLAFLISGPLAWYFMNSWLHDFVYRIALSWWIFAFAGAVVTAIALLTVSYQAVRAAMANPVNSLRSE